MSYLKPMNLVPAKTIVIMKRCVMFIAMSCYTTPLIQAGNNATTGLAAAAPGLGAIGGDNSCLWRIGGD